MIFLILPFLGIDLSLRSAFAKTDRQPSSEAPSDSKRVDCSSTKEYVTTLEFLRDQKHFAIPDPDSRKIADQVAQGCSGAAQRFIRTTSMLSKARLNTSESVRIGLEFSKRSEIEVQAFSVVFKKAFLEDGLDLDLATSVRLASRLSLEFKGDSKSARTDFERLLEFCLSEKDLNLPRPQCGEFAVRIAQYGEPFGIEISNIYINLFDFLRSSSGPQLTTGQSLPLAEKLLQGGKYALENFSQAYKYGVSNSGLGLSAQDSIHFAEKLTLPRALLETNQNLQNLKDKENPGT
jgi:hypothetical protein